jgi:NADH-quinone oxidoreductase subunit J
LFDFLTTNAEAILFYLFAAVALVGAVTVVTMRNPMYGAIGLLASFLAVAGLFLLRHAEFVAVVQIFVYGGGIMVLFLFVIMLVNLHRLEESRMVGNYWRTALVVSLLLVMIFGYLFVKVQFGPPFEDPSVFVNLEGEALGNSEAVSWKLYREYFLPFEIASVFLLVAMVGAVVLGRKA